MCLRTIAAVAVLALLPGVALAASKPPPAAILDPIDRVIHAANTDDTAAFSGLFSGDAIVVNENPPFIWRGAAAGSSWWRVVRSVTQRARIRHLMATNIRLGEFAQSATDAYLVQSLTVTGFIGSKPFAESGTMTYTLHEAGGRWLITSMVWTTKP